MASIRRTAALRALWVALRAAHKPGVPGVKERLAAVPRMVRLGLTGRYPFLDKRRLGLVVLGLVYLVSPLDFIPEMIMPLIGLGDDALVMTWLLGSLLAEAGDFLEWERGRARTVVGEVVG
jgi:uncharacterized membrane protein YkvA (DUF1232 family)